MKTLIAIATAALAVTTFAAPQGGPGKMQRGPHGGAEGPSDPVVKMVTNPKFAEKIGLTEDQTKQIKEIQKENRDNCETLRKQLKEAMEKQAELLKAEKVDEDAVMAEIDKAFAARKDLAKTQTKRIIAIKKVLTPEQIEKALEAAKNPPKRGKQFRGGKGEKPGDAPKCDGPKCEGKGGDCGPKCDGPDCDKPCCPPDGEPPCPGED